jgi:DNA sulfur modification protein DndB
MARKPKLPVLILPGLRGNFGSWIYYACLIPIHEINRRVEYATRIHTNNRPLSDLIQRSLEGPRATKIAEYLKTNGDRFFSSLVLAVYGGAPEWLEVGNLKSPNRSELVQEISERARDSIGFLRLSGNEDILAVDGQHRVAGIKKAIESGVDLEDEMVPVLLIGHNTNAQGMQRTRRLFTTLNKHAVPVAKKDIIALDEDDVMAITVRRLVEEHPKFLKSRIAIVATQQIPVSNDTSLTTIGNLYDILKLVFRHTGGQRDDKLRFNRPSDEKLAMFYDAAVGFFEALEGIAPPLKDYFARTPPSVGQKLRSSSGGHLLFRPIGLEIVTRSAIVLSRAREIPLGDAVHLLAPLPMWLEEEPFEGIIWDIGRGIILSKGKSLAVRLIAYMLGADKGDRELLADFRRARGYDPTNKSIALPKRL